MPLLIKTWDLKIWFDSVYYNEMQNKVHIAVKMYSKYYNINLSAYSFLYVNIE